MLLTILDIVFPRVPCVLLSDTLSEAELERYVTQSPHLPVPHCIAPLPYRNTVVQNVIHATKYHAHKRAPKLLAHAIAPFVAEELSERRMFGSFHKPLLTAIPLHKKRKLERGFNQSQRIAEALAQVLQDEHIEVQFDVLVRIKNTLPQTHRIDKAERTSNMKDAFVANPKHLLQGRDVLLIDDVVTTGATLLEARTACLQAGAKDVLCIAVAH